MNIWSLVLALAVIVILLILPCGSCRERYVPSHNYGKQALDDLVGRRLKTPKNSIDRIVFTKVKILPKEREWYDRLFSADKTVLFVGNPKYISSKTNTVIVGGPIKLEASGKSIQEAKANVNKRATAVLNDIRRVLNTAGLMANSS